MTSTSKALRIGLVRGSRSKRPSRISTRFSIMQRGGRLFSHLRPSDPALHRFCLQAALAYFLAILLHRDGHGFHAMRVLQNADAREYRDQSPSTAGSTPMVLPVDLRYKVSWPRRVRTNTTIAMMAFTILNSFLSSYRPSRETSYTKAGCSAGFSTQCPSSGKIRSCEGTLRICSEV